MNKQQFIRQYVIAFMATTKAIGLSQTASYPESMVMSAASIPQTELAYIAAEAAWEKLLRDGVLTDLEDE